MQTVKLIEVSTHLEQPCFAKEHEVNSGDDIHISFTQVMKQCGRK